MRFKEVQYIEISQEFFDDVNDYYNINIYPEHMVSPSCKDSKIHLGKIYFNTIFDGHIVSDIIDLMTTDFWSAWHKISYLDLLTLIITDLITKDLMPEGNYILSF